MTQTDDTTPLSFLTYFNATERDVLPFERPVLLGTYLAPSGDRAMVRTQGGQLRMMRIGDRIGQAKVTQIGEGRLDLALLGQIHTLFIPGRA